VLIHKYRSFLPLEWERLGEGGISKPYTLILTLSLKGEGINGWGTSSHLFCEIYHRRCAHKILEVVSKPSPPKIGREGFETSSNR
jgi:hypothetical protein